MKNNDRSIFSKLSGEYKNLVDALDLFFGLGVGKGGRCPSRWPGGRFLLEIRGRGGGIMSARRGLIIFLFGGEVGVDKQSVA